MERETGDSAAGTFPGRAQVPQASESAPGAALLTETLAARGVELDISIHAVRRRETGKRARP
jgi:hypothetical protein